MSKKGENIYKRKDGRWEARYPKGYTESGSIRYGYCYGKTYREAKEKVIILKSSIGTNNCKSNSSPKKRLNEYCDEWLQLNRTKVKESTLVKYTTCINKHVKPVLGGYYVKSINSLIVEDFSHKLLSERGLSTKTVRDILSILKSIFKYISLEIPEISSVNIVYPKEKKTEMRVLSIEEQTLFTRYLVTEMNMSKFGVLLALIIALAMNSNWCQTYDPDIRKRHIIVLFTDAEAHPLEKAAQGTNKFYPPNMPADIDEFIDMWTGQNAVMDDDAKRLVVYAPGDSDLFNLFDSQAGGGDIYAQPIEKDTGGKDLSM